MELSKEQLHEILVEPGHISAEDLDRVYASAQGKGRSPLIELVEEDLIEDKHLGKAVADYLDRHFINLHDTKIDQSCITILPEIVAQAQEAIVFGKENNILKVATTNPDRYDFFKLIEKKTGNSVEVYYTTPLCIEEILQLYKGDLRDRIEQKITSYTKNQQEEDAVELVNLFLEYAYTNHASDIHIEPLEDTVTVRFRIDGVLHRIAEYPHDLHEKIVFRIKILSRLRTDEHAAAQDGRFNYEFEDSSVDVRVSIMPVTDGENIVMRLLGNQTERLELHELGMLPKDLKKVEQAMLKTQGMILSVGPTGSGKTTTLYTILQILNKPEVNIMTIEDPVEYDVEHVQQTQVNADKELTFATGLRSIVRQDPDIIMVGEIRDNETADIAVNAAMTGHLLLSTLHTNDAATTFPRLMEMGIEPFLVASSVQIIVSQRLVRKICDKCRASYILAEKDIELLRNNPKVEGYLQEVTKKEELSKIRLFHGAGCKTCGNTGYQGRTGIFEVLEVTESIRRLITGKASSSVIDTEAKELGMTSMLYNGVVKVSEGITTLEEILRVNKG